MRASAVLCFLLVSGIGVAGCPQGEPSAAPSAPARSRQAPPDRWALPPPLDTARDLSGLVREGERLYVVQNRPSFGSQAQVFELSPGAGGLFERTGQWSLVQSPGAWVDAEAITTTGRGTMLVLAESVGGDGTARIWEVELPAGSTDTRPAALRRSWTLPEAYRESGGAGVEGLVRVPTPVDLDGPADALWVLVGHQARGSVGLFRLVDDEADRAEPITPVRELATDFPDTSAMEHTPGELWLWHNENLVTARCRRDGAGVNVLERYRWTAEQTPTELRGSSDRWKHPQPDDGPCRNLEGLEIGPCEDGRRIIHLVDDDGSPSAGVVAELPGLCPPGP